MNEVIYWLWLSTSPRIGPRAITELLRYYGSPEKMFFSPVGEITRLLPRNIQGAEELEKRDLDAAKRIFERCDSNGIDVVTLNEELYPERLRNIHLPPAVIYVRGKLGDVDSDPAVAIIGTRKSTPYGFKMAVRMGYEISKCGGTVVSGLTQGIDAAGAEGALRAGGRVVAVLGTPHELDRSRFSDDIVMKGAIVSEYPPGTKPYGSFFRARNRITSGLSLGTVVIEAPIKSGTRLFVTEAADQGKEIFAVPGRADMRSSEGNNLLLKEGAKPVTDGWDVMSEFAGAYPNKVRRVVFEHTDGLFPVAEKAYPKPSVSAEPEKKVVDKAPDEAYIDLKKQLEGLSPDQLRIIQTMDGGSVHVDSIIDKCSLAPAKVLAELTLLQIKGYVRQESGKRFTLNIKMK